MLDVLGAVFSGGLTGILGSAVSGIFKFLEVREANKAKVADRQHELRLQEIQMKAFQQETERELAIASQKSASEQMVASYDHDSKIGEGSQWCVNTLRLVRPAITLLSWAMVTMIWFTMNKGFLDAASQSEVMRYLIMTTVYTASASTLWWFGDRGRSFKK
jgi:ammonia channel protein AmtB|tara:strand:+ start:130 stop:612 length:483 start_codon:yes stop_codon:yes gene_type:complete